MGGSFLPGRWSWRRREWRRTTLRTHTRRSRFCRIEDLRFVTKGKWLAGSPTIKLRRLQPTNLSAVFAVASKARTRWSKHGNVSTESRKTGRYLEQNLCAGRQRCPRFCGRRRRSRSGRAVIQRRSPKQKSVANVGSELGRSL